MFRVPYSLSSLIILNGLRVGLSERGCGLSLSQRWVLPTVAEKAANRIGEKMYAVEFRTKMIDGIIKVPEKYRKKMRNSVKVILLMEDISDISSDTIGELLISPLRQPDFKSFKRDEIYDRS